jgi:hypothetical protein
MIRLEKSVFVGFPLKVKGSNGSSIRAAARRIEPCLRRDVDNHWYIDLYAFG